jgi:dihydrofolate synthase/folylpolyglutamate synthase
MAFMTLALADATHARSAQDADAYVDAVARLYALGQELAPLPPLPDGTPAPRRKWDLEHMRTLAAALGDPQRRFPSVLIAGTNGKGSTAATLASILAAAGYKAALYTSPHLVRVNERMVIVSPDGASQIPDDSFARLFARVEEVSGALVESGALPYPPSFFEVVTAIGFLYFAEEKVDIAVLEVGLGGRLDATNVVEPIVSVITDIALDHQEYLGDTIAEITREKAGILRKNGMLVTLPQHPEANQAIGEAAADLELQAFSAAEFIPSQIAHFNETTGSSEPLPRNRYTVALDGEALEVDSPLAGHHQQRNLALAIATAGVLRNYKGYTITNAAIEAGIRETMWPGRLEFVPPNLLLDVAHNPAGAWTLRAAIARLPESQPRTLIFSCLSDKNLTEMSRILFPLFDASANGERPDDHIILAPIANPRAAKVEDLLAAAQALDVPAHAAPHLAGALAQARQVTPPGGLIVATGSVYLVGAIRDLALAEKQNGAGEA